MKEIKLPSGETCLISDSDYPLVSKYKWHKAPGRNTDYARTYGYTKDKPIFMHRLILGLEDKPEIITDHKDRNGLNNQRDNIRGCSTSDNQKNRIAHGKSKYHGVHLHICKYSRWSKRSKKLIKATYYHWSAKIAIDKKQKHIGIFKDEIEAAKAYDKLAKIHHGEFARLNFNEHG